MRIRFIASRREHLKDLHPGYFAMVMATAIVATALRLHGLEILAWLLFGLNTLFLPILTALYIWRFIRYRQAFLADLVNPSRSVGFFTIVAAYGIYGGHVLTFAQMPQLAEAFWWLTLGLWFVIIYGILACLAVQKNKPGLADSIHGGWLVCVVGTQSLSIFTTTLASQLFAGHIQQELLFFALVLWLGGGVLYIWLMALIFLRHTFYSFSAEDFTPPYWINMGAVAISTLAGATLLSHAQNAVILQSLAVFISGLTLLFWAIGSWWIPMLIILGFWRYVLKEVPFYYEPVYWSGVFPLGMYSTCTYALTQVLPVGFLVPLSSLFMGLAICAWVLVFIGLLTNRLTPKH